MSDTLDAAQFELLKPALASKADEFRIYDYGAIAEEDLWAYCVKKLWKKKDPATLPIHELVGEILAISPANFMTHSQVEGLREASSNGPFAGLDEEEFRELLSPGGRGPGGADPR